MTKERCILGRAGRIFIPVLSRVSKGDNFHVALQRAQKEAVRERSACSREALNPCL